MGAIFFANGPAFKAGYTNPWIKMVDEYQIFTTILGIQGEEHEGTWERVEGMLMTAEDAATTQSGGGSNRVTNYNFSFILLITVIIQILLCN